MLPLSLDQASFQAVDALVSSGGLREGKTLDFKRDAAGPRDEDKREFIADVSAFANTVGGDLVFGVDEEGGEASSTPGVTLSDPDAEIRRLEALLRSGTEPRLSGIEIRWLERPGGKDGLLLVRVPRSLAAPHRVTFRDHAKFYGRTSAGKYPLDVAELRAAFLSADGLVQSIRRFRLERLSAIEAGETPVPLQPAAKVVLHIIPSASFLDPPDIVASEYEPGLPPLDAGSGFNRRHTLEGHATYPPAGDRYPTRGHAEPLRGTSCYTMLFRKGMVEAVGRVGHPGDDGRPYVAATSLEWGILQRFKRYVNALKSRDVGPPYYVFISLLGVRGHCLINGSAEFGLRHEVSQDSLLLPEAVMADADAGPEAVLKPLFDMVYNAFGFPASLNFDEAGGYIGQRW